MVAQIKEIAAHLKPYCITLDDQERSSRLTPKRGNEKHAALILALARTHKPPVSGVTPEAMERDAALYKALEPLAAVLAPFAQTITDTYRQAGHEYWQAFFAYYSALNGASGWNPELADEVKPVTEFMAQKESKENILPEPTETPE